MYCCRLKIRLVSLARICLFRLRGDTFGTWEVSLRQKPLRVSCFWFFKSLHGLVLPSEFTYNSVLYTHCTQFSGGASSGENGQVCVNYWSPVVLTERHKWERKICAESSGKKVYCEKKFESLIHRFWSLELQVCQQDFRTTSQETVMDIFLKTTAKIMSFSEEKTCIRTQKPR